ncbi:hypothetical protein ZWY2020_019350 [Hordeum vulgare]|nr:hypothetical protein ZWY2020_019350 [Hordeum vulgare]
MAAELMNRSRGMAEGAVVMVCPVLLALALDKVDLKVYGRPALFAMLAMAGQSETVADEATVVLPCLEVVLPSVEHEKTETVTESALTAVLPCLEVVLPSVELQTEEVEQCVPSTQSAEVQTEEVGHGQVQKLRGASGVIGKNTKSISINKLCAVEPNSGKMEKKSSGRKKQKK